MPFNTEQYVVAIKEETTAGAPETLAAADAFCASNLSLPGYDFEKIVRMCSDGSLGRVQAAILSGRTGTIGFSVALKGQGAAGTAPEYGEALKACGMAETIVASTSVTYKPTSVLGTYYTVGVYLRGSETGANKDYLIQLTGCQGNKKIVMKTGEPIMIDFEFSGVYVKPSDVDILTSLSLDTTTAHAFLNAGFTMHGFSAIIAALEVDMQNEIVFRDSAIAASGVITAQIVSREYTGTVDPEADLVVNHDFFGKMESSAIAATQTGVIGSTAGNKIQVKYPQTVYHDIQFADRNKLLINDTTLEILASSAKDDEESIILT